MEPGLTGSERPALSARDRLKLHRLCQALALGMTALIMWALFDRVELEPEFMAIQASAVVLGVLAAALVVYLVLRIGSSGAAVYWSGATGAGQVRRIGIMILTTVAVQMSAGAVMAATGHLNNLSSSLLGIAVWISVPAAFLALGVVKWPTRLKSVAAPMLLLATVLGVGVASFLTYAGFNGRGGVSTMDGLNELTLTLAGIVAAATPEEIVMRVLLLTALLDLGTTRLQAVFLSSAVFAAVHAPLSLSIPLYHWDWPMMQFYAWSYVPEFPQQAVLGMLLGVLWLRTGSITLVVVTHAILNVGTTLAQGV